MESGTAVLKTHVTGVLKNMRTRARAFIDVNEIPHDSNLTINVLLHTICDIQEEVNLRNFAYTDNDDVRGVLV